ncbi:hypothetical protein MVEN_01567900 [Mycena venus]|uniref:Uncharacterized protein n=1 Tax=Mycena venus TaxID=2733690 RepID=A0A8H6XRN9_9AGAR|nr:hypothetical protein MVEN_01567900 [Mycena venus]
MYPLHIALASTSRSSSDVVVDGDKAGPQSLLTPTNAIQIIQLVEMPAPPRRMPPSSASASSSSSSSASSCGSSIMDLDAEEQEDEDCDSYCSSAADDVDDEEEALAREAEASKVSRILAWRANLASPTIPQHPLSLSPTTPRPRFVPPPLSLSPTTPTHLMSRKRSAASSSCFSDSSAPRSKRSRTSSVHCTAGPSEYSRMVEIDSLPAESSSRTRGPAPAPLFLAPPSPTTLARRHTSPRHQRHSSSPSAHPSPPAAASSSAPALYSPTTPTPDLHRALSMTTSDAVSLRETLCPACDRAFSSVRAFRVHALHSADADAGAACGAAVAYAMEAVRGP